MRPRSLQDGRRAFTGTFSPASNVVVPAGSYWLDHTDRQQQRRATHAFAGVQATFKTPAAVSGAGGLFCYTVRITAVTGGGLTLDVDDSLTPTALISSQTIFIPEMVLPLLVISVLIPVASRVRRSHKKQGRRL